MKNDPFLNRNGSRIAEREREKHTGPLASGGVSTGGATALLDVETATATSHAESVTLVPPLSETPRSLRLQSTKSENKKMREKAHRGS